VNTQCDKEFPWQRKEVNLLCVDERLGKEFEEGGEGVVAECSCVWIFVLA